MFQVSTLYVCHYQQYEGMTMQIYKTNKCCNKIDAISHNVMLLKLKMYAKTTLHQPSRLTHL